MLSAITEMEQRYFEPEPQVQSTFVPEVLHFTCWSILYLCCKYIKDIDPIIPIAGLNPINNAIGSLSTIRNNTLFALIMLG